MKVHRFLVLSLLSVYTYIIAILRRRGRFVSRLSLSLCVFRLARLVIFGEVQMLFTGISRIERSSRLSKAPGGRKGAPAFDYFPPLDVEGLRGLSSIPCPTMSFPVSATLLRPWLERTFISGTRALQHFCIPRHRAMETRIDLAPLSFQHSISLSPSCPLEIFEPPCSVCS